MSEMARWRPCGWAVRPMRPDEISVTTYKVAPSTPAIHHPGMAFRFVRRLLACGLLMVAVTPCADAATDVRKPRVTWLRGEGNYTPANRTWHSIRCIVIHATEGPFWGSVSWLQNEDAHGSAHFIVSRTGTIVQIVHPSDIAWHSGNARINAESIGIEHEGITADPAGFTLPEYRASARLAAWVARNALLPIDRRHLIGHSEVPDPFHPGLYGGSSHHTDPGAYWNWNLYLRLVRRYAFPVKPLKVKALAPMRDSGFVPWRAVTTGPRPARVEFRVDGRLLWIDRHKPFTLPDRRGWNSTHVENGRHTLEVRAVAGRQVVLARRFVLIRNRRFALTSAGVKPARAVKGPVTIRVKSRGGHAVRVSLVVDGRRLSRDERRPFSLRWDTRQTVDGRHTVELIARASDGRLAHRKLQVVVANHQSKPKPNPKPTPAPPAAILSQSMVDGQSVQGTVDWQVQARNAVRVEFLVDGAVRASATAEPYAYAWDTTAETAGEHLLLARAVARDGRSVEAAVKVTVVPTSQPAP